MEGKRILAAKERELNEKTAALDKTVSDRLAAERVNLSKELEAQLRSGFSTEIADLKRQADERSGRATTSSGHGMPQSADNLRM